MLLIPGVLAAQSIPPLAGASAQAIGYAVSCTQDAWSVFNNIGGLAGVKHVTTAFSYETMPHFRFGDRMAAVFVMPVKTGAMGFGLYRFGDDLYHEQIMTAGYSNVLGLASLGIRINILQYYADGFGNKHLVTIHFGGRAELTSGLYVGAYIINIHQPVISATSGERVPTLLSAGIACKPSSNVFFTSEVEKDLEYDLTWKTGIEYRAHRRIFFRTGFNIPPDAGFIGFGFKTGRYQIDYAMQYSFTTGMKHQASITYAFRAL